MRKLQPKSLTVGDRGDAIIRPICVTLTEAADILSVCRKTVYRFIAAGSLEAIKIGKCTRVTTASIDRLRATVAE